MVSDLRFTLLSGRGQATYTSVPLSLSSIFLPAKGGDLFDWKSDCGPGEK